MITDPKNAILLKVTGRLTGASSLFMKLDYLYPECSFMIQDSPQLFPLKCFFNDGCPRNRNCIETLSKRVNFVFDTFTDVEYLYLYFKWPDRPGSQRSVLFFRDNTEPRFLTFNRLAWERWKKLGTVYEWRIPDSIFLDTKTTQIP